MTDRELLKLVEEGMKVNAPDSPEYIVCAALRARLAQPEPEPVAWMYDWWDESEDLDGVPTGGEICDCITKDYDEAHSPTMGCHNIRPLYTAPPQQEKQEPVAWIEHEWSGTGLQKLHFERPKPTVRDDVVNPIWIPLYTAPPQREWVGLTDEDMNKLWHLVDWTVPLDIKKFARAIEAKLKEKNNG